MQDAFVQDMFNLGGVNSSRCNGHIPLSTPGNASKRDRKGCKKGKIEAIMKNNMVSSKSRVRLQTSPVVKKLKPAPSNIVLKSGVVIKNECLDADDPYTFTETAEPFTLGPGSTNLTVSRKLVPLLNNKSKGGVNMVCVDRDPDKLSSVELSSKSFGTKPVKNVQNLEGSSKTMNKLQADIARNKVIGKRKKMVVNSNVSTNSWDESQVKTEPSSSQEDDRTITHVTIPPKRRHQQTWQREKKYRHEALQRLQLHKQRLLNLKQDLYPLGVEFSDSESEDEDWQAVYQRHWFSGCDLVGCTGRESQLAQADNELRRRVCQMWRGLDCSTDPSHKLFSAAIEAALVDPNTTAMILNPKLKLSPKLSRAKKQMLVPQMCCVDECGQMALPCARHCSQHIMYNVDQQLYKHCTAKFPDNTQCSTPVFDITHHQPLCHKHGSIFDNVMKSHLEGRLKKCIKKKSKPPTMSKSTKRGKKKKKPQPSDDCNETDMSEVEVKTEPLMVDEEEDTRIDHMDEMMLQSSPSAVPVPEVFLSDAVPCSQVEIQVQLEDAVEVVSDEVLAIASMDPTDLASQASRLLEEHDITSMLNQIPADAFTELFLAEDKNGVFGPTIEQTEGLERALEAVDKEVRSLERMTSSLPLMPIDSINLLDDVGGYVTYPNGFTPIAQTVQTQPELRHS